MRTWPVLLACIFIGCAAGDDDTGDVNHEPDSGIADFSCPAGVDDGQPCDSPGAPSCSIEGTASCETPPAGGICACDADGTWHCFCGCYGAQSICPIDTAPGGCPLVYHPELDGARCDPALGACNYDAAVCTCVDDGAGAGMFACD